MTLHLSKLHGSGNDFLVTTALDLRSVPGPEVARALCDRRRGVGADGLLTLLPPTGAADCAMQLRNADGGPAEMSGNGISCLAWVAAREGLGTRERIRIETEAGVRTVELRHDAGGEVLGATVDMGVVTFEPAEIPLDAPSAQDLEATFHRVTYRGDAVGVGNPHFVVIVDDVDKARVAQHGPRLEHDERFPNRTNVEFAALTGPDQVKVRIWERGVGETLSCGTGVTAVAAVFARRGLVGPRVDIEVPGGHHLVELGETARLSVSVTHVFDVELDVARLLFDAELRS
jgi:diaminopimelate epimerase